MPENVQPVPQPAEQSLAAAPAPAAGPSMEQMMQAIQMLAQSVDALQQDYMKTKETVTGIIDSLNADMSEADQAAFLSELNSLGEEYALGPEEKKLLYEDYQALVKEAGDQAPSALEYFKEYVPQMTKGTSDRMAKLDAVYKALVDKENASKPEESGADEEALQKQQLQSIMEAV